MITIEERRDIYIQYFTKFHSIRKISKDLNISRDTVTKLITEYREKIEQANLLDEPDLSKYIDKIVTIPQRKPRILHDHQADIYLINDLVLENEKRRTLPSKGKYKTYKELYEDYNNASYKTISFSYFYQLAKGFKFSFTEEYD